jgi:hypothetical protein
VALPEKRQQMVLAEAVKVDVLHDDHLAVVDGEQRVVQDLVDVGVVAAGEELERFLDAFGRVQQPLAARVFAELGKQLPDERLQV